MFGRLVIGEISIGTHPQVELMYGRPGCIISHGAGMPIINT